MRFGKYTLFGPAAQIYTPMHPTDATARRRPGVTIGDRR